MHPVGFRIRVRVRVRVVVRVRVRVRGVKPAWFRIGVGVSISTVCMVTLVRQRLGAR